MTISRRTFVTTGAAAAASLALGERAGAEPVLARVGERAARVPLASRPVVIASGNGLRGVARAYDMITRQGADTLDAIIAGVNIQELDPEDQSVGLGGLPNADGVVQLDASCMHGPTKRAGAVACLEGIATPSLVAKAVMDYTNHVLLVGEGAKKFALGMGFTEQNLLTEKSRKDWLRWKACLNPSDNWLDAPGMPRAPARTSQRDSAPELGVNFTTGTINMNAVNAAGDISSVTTTSGLSWKIPGRVGDSPIVGAGQYCDNTVGAAGSTGRGESCIKTCGAFLIVEFMRQGLSPEQACLKTIERVIATTEPRLLDGRGRPTFSLQFYAVAKDGRFGAAALYEGGSFAVADSQGARMVPFAFMFRQSEKPQAAVSCSA
ncbi:MAG: N(4)-(beta-N-acetylglucosaminyl)-L-asparaginase [Gemmatimonadaceae bacterium]|nr:N(4)-(beta-N-acetylglucosaminyl)-L-asparaginase [Gemmatimonadaceae bacterium]